MIQTVIALAIVAAAAGWLLRSWLPLRGRKNQPGSTCGSRCGGTCGGTCPPAEKHGEPVN
jgi:hypothetical protein